MRYRGFDLTGQVASVTGANRGVGRQFARALAMAGADLVVTSREETRLDNFVREVEDLGRPATPLKLEVTERGSIDRFSHEVERRFEAPQIRVNNAGCNVPRRAIEVSWEDWNHVLDTDLRGTFFVS